MGHRLLLADDSITIQKVVGIIFSNQDYELSVVDNGTAAVDEARNLVPDVMLIDAIMPGKTGYEVCEEVRRDPSLSHVPVLLLTGVFEPFDEDKAKRAGADDFISKPFESQHLLEKVNNLIRIGAERKESAPAVAGAAAAVDPFAADPFGDIQIEDVPASDDFDIVSLSSEHVVTAAPEDDLWGAVDISADAGEEPVFGELVDEDLAVGVSAPAAAPVAVADEFTIDLGAAPAEEWGTAEDVVFGEEIPTDDVFAPVTPADDIFGAAAPAEDPFASIPVAEEADPFGTIDLGPEEGIDDVMTTAAAPPVEETAVPTSDFDVFAPVEEPVLAGATLAEPVAVEEPPAAPEPAAQPAGSAVTLTEEQLAEVIGKISREIIERIAWEVVPDLAESMIREEIRKITGPR